MADRGADPRCALWDAAGKHVECNRRLRDGRPCTFRLALLNPLRDYWGEWYRTLAFVHDEWSERADVWEETHRARMLREKGRPPAARANPPWLFGVEGLADRYPRGPRCYPTVVRCRACGNKRRLDAGILDIVSFEDVVRQVTQRAITTGLCSLRDALIFDGAPHVLLYDAAGARVPLSPGNHTMMRRAGGKGRAAIRAEIEQALRRRRPSGTAD